MGLDQSSENQSGTISRRTVVKTGVKLAYAAPVVVATFKLTEGGALAASCPRRYVFDASGPYGAGCYNCQTTPDFNCRSIRNDSLCPNRKTNRAGFLACRQQQLNDYLACRNAETACRRARYYNPATNRCETRAGVSGGSDCTPLFVSVTTP